MVSGAEDPAQSFNPMTITVPTTVQIAAALEGAARTIAAILVAVYVAGEMTGRAIHDLSDWFAALTRQPLQTLIDLIPTTEPQPAHDLLSVLEAEILEPEALELEIREFEAKQPVARRKPAKARKAKVAA
jgi:uncharacterized membrane-anchored protein YjiN (DUF445 family)